MAAPNGRLRLEALLRVARAVYNPQNLTEQSNAVIRVRLVEEVLRSGMARTEFDQAIALLRAEIAAELAEAKAATASTAASAGGATA